MFQQNMDAVACPCDPRRVNGAVVILPYAGSTTYEEDATSMSAAGSTAMFLGILSTMVLGVALISMLLNSNRHGSD
jgi:hypothetical protein